MDAALDGKTCSIKADIFTCLKYKLIKTLVGKKTSRKQVLMFYAELLKLINPVLRIFRNFLTGK